METLILQYSCSTYDHFSSPMFLSLPLLHKWKMVSLLGDYPSVFMNILFFSPFHIMGKWLTPPIDMSPHVYTLLVFIFGSLSMMIYLPLNSMKDFM
jgi:hypothetical protein